MAAGQPLPAQIVEWNDDTRKAYAAGIERLKSLPPNYVERTPNGVIYVTDSFSRNPPDVRVEIFKNPQQAQFENTKCLLLDHLGYLWMGTNGGLLRFDGYQFKYYNKQNLDSTALPGSQVRAMTEDREGNIWLGTDNGYCCYNRQRDAFDHLSEWYPENYWMRGTDRHYNHIYQDPLDDGKIWLTTWRRGIQQLDKKSGQIEDFQDGRVLDAAGREIKRRPPSSAETCFRHPDGTLWANAITLLTEGGDILHSFHLQKRLWQIFEIPHALYLYDAEYNARPEVHDLLNFIFPDPDQRHIWTGGYGEGLHRFDIPTHQWEQFYLKKPFVPYDSAWTQTNSLWNLDILPDGRLLLASSYGLLLFSPADRSFHLLNRADAGMKIEKFQHQSGAFSRSAGGQVFYANNTKALLFISTAPLGQDKAGPPKVYFHSFTAFPTGPKPLRPDQRDTLFLDRQETSFRVSFYALPFVLPNRLQYRTFLEGRDRQWVERDTLHTLLFDQLPGGMYRLRVQARQPGGAWNEAGEAAFHFQVERVFWENWWFKWLVVAVVAVTGIVFYVLRLRQARRDLELATLRQRKAEFQKRLAEIEMDGLRAQMNPHFMFNCLASINHFLQENRTQEATEYLTQFARLVQLVLDNSQHDRLALHHELTTLELYLRMEQMRFGEKFRYRIEVGPELDPQTTYLPPMLIQPYVENALWHGLYHKKEGGEVLVQISKTDSGRLRIIVRDDGIGRARARELESRSALEKKSHGMAITAERIGLLNQLNDGDATVKVLDLMDEYGHAAGTEVQMEL